MAGMASYRGPATTPESAEEKKRLDRVFENRADFGASPDGSSGGLAEDRPSLVKRSRTDVGMARGVRFVEVVVSPEDLLRTEISLLKEDLDAMRNKLASALATTSRQQVVDALRKELAETQNKLDVYKKENDNLRTTLVSKSAFPSYRFDENMLRQFLKAAPVSTVTQSVYNLNSHVKCGCFSCQYLELK